MFQPPRTDLAPNDKRERGRRNIAALTVVKSLKDGTLTSDALSDGDRIVLSRYTGFGALSEVFDTRWTSDEELKEQRQKVAELLSDEELSSARAAILDAYFTQPELVDLLWSIAAKLGFAGGRVLEAGAGIGNFIGWMPPELRAASSFIAVENDSTSAQIIQGLYPEVKVRAEGLEDVYLPEGYVDLVIGNVPFGEVRIRKGQYKALSPLIHDYFFLRAVDHLRPGSLAVLLTSTGTLDKKNPHIRSMLDTKAELVAAFRLPQGIFRSYAGTEAAADIIVLRKRENLITEHPSSEPDWRKTYCYQGEEDKPGAVLANEYFRDNESHILGGVEIVRDRFGHNTVGAAADPAKAAALVTKLVDGLVAAAKLPALTAAPSPADSSIDLVTVPEWVLVDGHFVGQTSKGPQLCRARRDANGTRYGEIVEITPDNRLACDRVLDGLRLLDTIRPLLIDSGTPQERDRLRSDAQSAYKAIRQRHGALNDRRMKSAFAGDPQYHILTALELINEPKEGDRATKVTYSMGPIFTREILFQDSQPTITGPADAIGVCLDRHAAIRLPEFKALLPDAATLTDADAERLLAAHAFRVPGTDRWELNSIYLSGDVKTKLAEARALADLEPDIARNVEALEKVLPPLIPYSNIEARLGAPWIPTDVISEFVASILSGRKSAIKVSYSEVIGRWRMDIPDDIKGSVANRSRYGHSKMPAHDMIQKLLNNAPLVVYTVDGDGKQVTDRVATEEVRIKAETIVEEFAGWIYRDIERALLLQDIYNEQFNRYVDCVWDGSHLTFSGLSEAWAPKIRDLQRNAVFQHMIRGMSGLYIEVGGGKTMTAGLIINKMKQIGRCRKAMFAVLPSTLIQVRNALLEVFPSLKLYVVPTNLDKAARLQALAHIAMNDWDCVLIGHDTYDRIPVPTEFEANLLSEIVEELRGYLDVVKNQASDRDDSRDRQMRRKSLKDIERSIARHEARIKMLRSMQAKDQTLDIQSLGIDLIITDEAQRYKNLYVETNASNVRGIPQAQSARALEEWLKAQWIERTFGRGYIEMTGTPLSNTIGEAFNIQRRLQLSRLRDRGVHHFDAWIATFGEICQSVEITVAGTFKTVTRLKSFNNVPELRHMMSDIMYYISLDDVPEVERPVHHKSVITSPPLPIQRKMLAWLASRAENIRYAKADEDGFCDNMLAIASDGRKGAVDIRLVWPHITVPDDAHTKISDVVNTVAEIRRRRPRANQMIFLDIGINPAIPRDLKPKKRKKEQDASDASLVAADDEIELANAETLLKEFEVFHGVADAETAILLSDTAPEHADDTAAAALEAALQPQEEETSAEQDLRIARALGENAAGTFTARAEIKRRLIEAGVPADRIIDFCDATTDTKKVGYICTLRKPGGYVAIGSTQRMGTGTDAPMHLIAAHHVDIPMTPAGREQRDGRHVRQGNLYSCCFSYYYVTTGTFDAFLWQLNANKERFIKAFLRGGAERRIEESDAGDISPVQIMAIATGDTSVVMRIEMENKINRMRRLQEMHDRDIADAHYRIESRSKQIVDLDRDIAIYNEILADQEAYVMGIKLVDGDKKGTFKPGQVVRGFKEIHAALAAKLLDLANYAHKNRSSYTAETRFDDIGEVVPVAIRKSAAASENDGEASLLEEKSEEPMTITGRIRIGAAARRIDTQIELTVILELGSTGHTQIADKVTFEYAPGTDRMGRQFYSALSTLRWRLERLVKARVEAVIAIEQSKALLDRERPYEEELPALQAKYDNLCEEMNLPVPTMETVEFFYQMNAGVPADEARRLGRQALAEASIAESKQAAENIRMKAALWLRCAALIDSDAQTAAQAYQVVLPSPAEDEPASYDEDADESVAEETIAGEDAIDAEPEVIPPAEEVVIPPAAQIPVIVHSTAQLALL